MEEEIDLREYVEVLIRHWMWIVGLAVVAAATALAVSLLMPPTYEAAALAAVTDFRYVMHFEPRLETVENAELPSGAYSELATSDDLLQILLSELSPGLEGVESALDLRGMVEAELTGGSRMVRLTVRSSDPTEAARVANAWLEVFVEQANAIYGSRGEEDLQFFQTQLEQAEADLEAAEEALVSFQAQNQAAILEAQLASAQRDLTDYLSEQRGIERVTRSARTLRARLVDQPTDAPVDAEDDLAALLLQLQILSVRPSFELQVSDASLLSSDQTVSEVLSSIDSMVESLETREGEIEAQVETLEPQILGLQQQLQDVRAERDRLVRDRDVAQETYLTLARKVEEARIAAEDGVGRVRVASQAGVPRNPVGPRTKVNVALAGALGLMMGVFGAFAVEWWRDGEAPEE